MQVSGYLMLVSMQFHCRCFPTWKCRSSRFLRGAHEFPTTKERTTTRHMSSLAVAVFSIAGDVQWVYSKLKGVLGPFLAQMHCRYKQEWTQTSARRKKNATEMANLRQLAPGSFFFPAGSTDCLLKMNRNFYCLLASCFVCLARSPTSSSGTTCYHVLLIAKGYCLA